MPLKPEEKAMQQSVHQLPVDAQGELQKGMC